MFVSSWTTLVVMLMGAPASLVALAADGAAAAAPHEAAQEESPSSAAEEHDEDDEDDEDDDGGARRRKGVIVRGYGKTGTVGLPGVGFGGGLSVGWMRRHFRFDFMGGGQLNRSAWYPGNTVGGDFSLWRAGMRVCAVLGSGRVATPICGGADGGMVTATGVGIESARTERQPWGSVFADIDLAWHVRPNLALVTTSRWLVPLVRRQYYVGERGTLVSTPPFGVEIGLGLELVLP